MMSRIPVRLLMGLVSLFATVSLTLPAAASQVNLQGRVADIWPNAAGAVADIWPNLVEAVIADIWPNSVLSDPNAGFLGSD